ncbi:MAG: FAD-dependent oxidoreductase [Rhizobiaceae bacterium]|nr:FAD-dependent oxidoreductase [Rhizobiaceae bacterium]
MDARGAVIVGAGECGARAAFALREEGYAGPTTLIGEETHLPYERPPLSKEGMASDASGLKLIADAAHFADAGIRLLLGSKVIAIDRAAKTVSFRSGSTIPYEMMLLATGARPRRLPLAEASGHCLYLRTQDEANAIASRFRQGAHVVIVGGGFIGLELAAAASRHGCTVSLLEAAPRLLARAVPPEIAEVIGNVHRSNGVDIRLGVSIAGFQDMDRGVEVHLAEGAPLRADFCIIGIGAVPNTELAQEAGLAVDNGIRVDGTLRTDDPYIFAAGDCCSFPLSIYGGRRVRLETWRNAQEQGTLAAKNMAGGNIEHAAVPWFWSDQYDRTLQIAGLPDEGTQTVRRDLADGAFLLFHLAGDGRLVAASGIGIGNAIARDIRLAEMLVARRAVPAAGSLASAAVKLKTLLAA